MKKMRILMSLILTMTVLFGFPAASFAAGCPYNPTGEHVEGAVDMNTHISPCLERVVHYVICAYCNKQFSRSETYTEHHEWSSWEITKEATCTETGERFRTCRKCGEVRKEPIPRTNHTYRTEAVVREATPFSAGTRTIVCTICGFSAEETYWPEGTLKAGDEGDRVLTLQNRLTELGYKAGARDGVFGDMTGQAVSAYEKANQLQADGIAWPGLQEMMGLPVA